MCDGQRHCSDLSDESYCEGTMFEEFSSSMHPLPVPPPAVITFLPASKEVETRRIGLGYVISLVQRNTHGQDLCPETHFQCPGGGYCLPVYVRCNQVRDCPGGQDEARCDSYTCPGFYRCRASRTCLHVSHVCDTIRHCPQDDDELLCDLPCPANCTCYGLAFRCYGLFLATEYPSLRYIDVAGVRMSPQNLAGNKLLVFLSLSNCGLTSAESLSFPNLRTLDLSDNFIASVSTEELRDCVNLRLLRLAGTSLSDRIISDMAAGDFKSIVTLDLSRADLEDFNVSILANFTNLQSLNLSNSRLHVHMEGFRSLAKLKTLDLRGCPFSSFPNDMFMGLTSLTEVYSDDYKLCCSAILPRGFKADGCKAPYDIVSSCTKLIGQDVNRRLLSVFATLSLLGNIASFMIQIIKRTMAQKNSIGLLLVHLTVCDFLMGIYLAVILVADGLFDGDYLWHDVDFRHSGVCKLSGFVFLLSSVVSLFITSLLTYQSCWRLYLKSSLTQLNVYIGHAVAGVIWCTGILLAVVPLFPTYSSWRFFSQSGLCVPVPKSSLNGLGHDYRVGVLVILNLVLSTLSCIAHVLILYALKTYTVTAENPTGSSPTMRRARRVFWMTLTHCLCRLSFAVTDLLFSRDDTISKEIRVTTLMTLLPVSSAAAPWLYALGVVMERRRNEERERLMKQLKALATSKQLKKKTGASRTTDCTVSKIPVS